MCYIMLTSLATNKVKFKKDISKLLPKEYLGMEGRKNDYVIMRLNQLPTLTQKITLIFEILLNVKEEGTMYNKGGGLASLFSVSSV